jgi:hypothetical protein
MKISNLPILETDPGENQAFKQQANFFGEAL